MKRTNWIVICGVLGALAVGLGAFGAHGLKDVLDVAQLKTYNTGIMYHFYHTLAIGLVVALQQHRTSKWYSWSAILFVGGILLFSGSLYLLSTREVLGLHNYQWLGPITPLGGVCFILGWLFLSIGGIQRNR